jgi:sirohydrochlorin cobaltochelatase
MNCLLCKYRDQIIGHEAAVGAPQEAHHHHVEGIGTAAAHPHHRHHGHHHHQHSDGADVDHAARSTEPLTMR